MGENGAGSGARQMDSFLPAVFFAVFCGTTRFARSLSQRASDLDAELQFGTSSYLASLVVGRQSAGGWGADAGGGERALGALCSP